MDEIILSMCALYFTIPYLAKYVRQFITLRLARLFFSNLIDFDQSIPLHHDSIRSGRTLKLYDPASFYDLENISGLFSTNETLILKYDSSLFCPADNVPVLD